MAHSQAFPGPTEHTEVQGLGCGKVVGLGHTGKPLLGRHYVFAEGQVEPTPLRGCHLPDLGVVAGGPRCHGRCEELGGTRHLAVEEVGTAGGLIEIVGPAMSQDRT